MTSTISAIAEPRAEGAAANRMLVTGVIGSDTHIVAIASCRSPWRRQASAWWRWAR